MKPSVDQTAGHSLRLFLVLENRLLSEALCGIFRRQSDMSVLGSLRYDSSTFKAVLDSRCDIVLTDQPSAKGFASNFISDISSARPQTRFIFIGMANDPDVFLEAVRSGVSGYLLREASTEDTLSAIRKVGQGEAVCPPFLCLNLFHFVAKMSRQGSLGLNRKLCIQLGLTSRQQQLVSLLAKGLTNKEIASSLNLSEFTVKNHVHRIMRQLNADSRLAAVETVCDASLSAGL